MIVFVYLYLVILDGASMPANVQMALNDLPTIYPLTVSVNLSYTSYQVTFPVEMGDIPLLTIISSAFDSPQNASEIVKGVASGSKLAFELDGATTHFLDLWDDNITDDVLQNEFHELFNIRCPPSLNNQDATPSIVYVDEFETEIVYDETTAITDMAFCGHSSTTAGPYSEVLLVNGNTQTADYMCFAYKSHAIAIIMVFQVESNDDPNSITSEYISISLIADTRWHYKCITLRDTLGTSSSTYLTVATFIITNVYVYGPQYTTYSILLDTVTLRTAMPMGYEDAYAISMTDQSSSNQCTFPFLYNGLNYYTCTLNDNKLPICGSTSNQTYYCQSSSIEGVRRLYPKYQLLNNLISITHTAINHTIDISFRYTACNLPTLIKSLPSTVSHLFHQICNITDTFF
jgi:hypothetical protein